MSPGGEAARAPRRRLAFRCGTGSVRSGETARLGMAPAGRLLGQRQVKARILPSDRTDFAKRRAGSWRNLPMNAPAKISADRLERFPSGRSLCGAEAAERSTAKRLPPIARSVPASGSPRVEEPAECSTARRLPPIAWSLPIRSIASRRRACQAQRRPTPSAHDPAATPKVARSAAERLPRPKPPTMCTVCDGHPFSRRGHLHATMIPWPPDPRPRDCPQAGLKQPRSPKADAIVPHEQQMVEDGHVNRFRHTGQVPGKPALLRQVRLRS